MTRWNGTPNGIEALAGQYCDTTLVLDELGTAAQGQLGATIYRLSAGEGKARATPNGEYRSPTMIRTTVFATGEVTRTEQVRSGGEASRDGHEVRLLTVPVCEPQGTFSVLPPDCKSGADFSRRLSVICSEHYGHAMPAFLRAVIENQDSIARRAPVKLASYQMDIKERVECGKLSPIEERVLESFSALAFAGKAAIHYGVLPVTGQDVIEAVSHVFGLWLAHWRESTGGSDDSLVAHVRGWFQRNASASFPPLADWANSGQRNRVGYLFDHRREREVYLVHYDAMRQIVCDGLNLDAVLRALIKARLLVTPKKGRQWLQRMPGVPKDSAGSRMKFYAIRCAILFDQ